MALALGGGLAATAGVSAVMVSGLPAATCASALATVGLMAVPVQQNSPREAIQAVMQVGAGLTTASLATLWMVNNVVR